MQVVNCDIQQQCVPRVGKDEMALKYCLYGGLPDCYLQVLDGAERLKKLILAHKLPASGDQVSSYKILSDVAVIVSSDKTVPTVTHPIRKANFPTCKIA